MNGNFEVTDNMFVVRMPIEPYLSASGKSIVLCSTHGSIDTGLRTEDGNVIRCNLSVFASKAESRQAAPVKIGVPARSKKTR